MKKFLKVVGYLVLLSVVIGGAAIIYILSATPDVGEAPDLKVEISPDRVERGRYLATSVMGCMDCHAQRDWSHFAGPVKPGTTGGGGELFGSAMGLPGEYYSPNLTPYHLGDWTDGEIFRAVTSGVSKDGRALFPIMPYLNYGQLDKEDIFSVIAYLRTLEPVENDVQESVSHFPMNIIIHTIPRKPEFTQRPDQANRLAYGKYMFTAAACGECHTPVKKGEAVPGKYLAGGMEFSLPNKVVSISANITPDRNTGIGSWTPDQFVQRFNDFNETVFSSYPVKDYEFNTIMPWMYYSRMRKNDLEAIHTYLSSVEKVNNRLDRYRVSAPR
ncbi:MAG: cytochrome C [Owenweeksia sp.]|mgnify:CR=1 FL=1|nr:cytochrome C [Owenweeksia sp.]|tara:strand:+ start:2387 stop:3373 length:987 start_codon:yes stop_codon:yes gene_type:complete